MTCTGGLSGRVSGDVSRQRVLGSQKLLLEILGKCMPAFRIQSLTSLNLYRYSSYCMRTFFKGCFVDLLSFFGYLFTVNSALQIPDSIQ